MFDPCGTRVLDGEEILKRIAKELNIDITILRNVLTNLGRV